MKYFLTLVFLAASFSVAVSQDKGAAVKIPSKGVTQEIWENVRGTTIENLTNNNGFKKDKPSQAKVIDKIDIADLGNEYGARYTAFLTPAKSGEYTFWLAADDAAEVFLSVDDTREKLASIVHLKSYTGRKAFNNWGKSQPVKLESKKKYYLEILHKQAGGADHLAVAWSAPGMEREILTSKYLSPVLDGQKEKILKQTVQIEKKQQELVKEFKSKAVNDVPAYLEGLSEPDRKLLAKSFTAVLASVRDMNPRDAVSALAPYAKLAGMITPSKESPIKNPAAKQLLYIEDTFLNLLEPSRLKAMGPHRLASALGEIPEGTKPGKLTVELNSKPAKQREEFVSTGVYALPGVPLVITIPADMVNMGLEVQIGHHIEPGDRSDLVSMPLTTRRFPLTAQTTQYITPHGGLMFVIVPGKQELKKVPFQFQGVIPAPRFILGETTDEQWKSIRNNPAPWGELVSEHLLLLVHREALQKLDNPTELMTWWNENNRRHEDFYGYYPHFPFRMHAALYAREGISYWPLEWKPENMEPLLDIKIMLERNSALYLHEHGHHADFNDMEFGYSSESTPNWAGYYMKSTTPFDWKDDPTVHLVKLMDPNDEQHNEIKQPDWYSNPNKGTHHWSYPITSMMLGYVEDFGWEPFKKTIHRIRDRKDPMYSWEFTGTKTEDPQKIDRYIIGLSQEAKRDVRPYFAHFMMFPSDGADAFLDELNLPKWDATHLPPPSITKIKAGETLTIPASEQKALSMAGPVTLKWLKPEQGTLAVKQNGDAIYTPGEGFAGTARIPYSLETKVGISPVKYITITIEEQ